VKHFKELFNDNAAKFNAVLDQVSQSIDADNLAAMISPTGAIKAEHGDAIEASYKGMLANLDRADRYYQKRTTQAVSGVFSNTDFSALIPVFKLVFVFLKEEVKSSQKAKLACLKVNLWS